MTTRLIKASYDIIEVRRDPRAMEGNEMFEKGLPGFDAWLDNHGNPWLGGGDDNGEEWPFNEPVDMTQVSEDEYKIERVLGDDETLTIKIVEIDGARRMLIDDKLRNLGEHYIDYISLIDSFHEQFSGAIGAKFRVEPFEDEDENA